MNRLELIAAVAEETDMAKAAATQAVDAVFAAIERALKSKQEVRLTGFGSFMVTERKATTGRDPRTGAPLNIAASNSVRFKPGKALKDAVK